MFEFKDQYVAVFTKIINHAVTIQGKKKFKLPIDSISFRKHTYQIDTKWLTYRNKNKFIYYIDMDRGQMTFQKFEGQVMHSALMDKIVNGHIISQLVSGLASVGTIPWVWGVVFITLGIFAGIVIGWVLPIGR